MSALALLRRSARLVTVLVLAELTLGWALAYVSVRSVHALVARHPDGVRALFTNGARGMFDIAAHANLETALRASAVALAAVLVLYAIVGIAIDTLAASAFTRARSSLRSLGTVVAIDLAAILAYAALGIVAALSATGAHHATHAWANARTADLSTLAAIAPTLAVALLVHVTRDLALVRATCPSDVLTSVGDAVAQLARHPRETLGARVLTLAGSAILLAAAAFASWNVNRAAAVIVVVCVAIQQIAAAGRTLLRFHWLAHVAALWQAKTP